MEKKIIRIGHRGAAGYEPENTLRSFQKALACGADMVECDVWLTADNELVVIHDSSVNRTTNGTGLIKLKTFEDLTFLDAGKGEKIPKLIEVMDLVVKKSSINIEFKDSRCAHALADFLKKQISEGKWQVDDILISSFSWKTLRLFHREAPMFKIGILIHRYPLFVRTAVATNAFSINLPLYFAYKPIVQFIHLLGWKVFIYTVNDLGDIFRMKEINVDGIFSDFPDRL